MHGIILEGGTAADIIPGRTSARFIIIRSQSSNEFERMRERFRAMVEAAARATG